MKRYKLDLRVAPDGFMDKCTMVCEGCPDVEPVMEWWVRAEDAEKLEKENERLKADHALTQRALDKTLKDWLTMKGRAEKAEAKIAALQANMSRSSVEIEKENFRLKDDLAIARKREKALQSELWAEKAQHDLCKEREARLRDALKDCMNHIDVDNLTMQTKYREWEQALNRGKKRQNQ